MKKKYCKVIEKCKKCSCCETEKADGLASQIAVPRPTERIIERQLVELATRCEPCCDCKEEAENA